MAVADFVQELLSFEPAVTDDFLLDKQLKQIRHDIEKANPAVLTTISLSLFDPSIHTLSYLLILNAHVQSVKSSGKSSDKQPKQLLPQGTLWPYITDLLLNFDPLQVRYAGAAFVNLYQGLATAAEQTADIAVALTILHNVILRLDPTSSTLTPAHFCFIRLCVKARAFAEAADILARPIVSLPFDTDKATQSRSYKYLCSYQESSATYLTPQTGLNIKWTYRGYLEYFLMGGLVYMALRQFSKAQFYLEIVLTAPTSNPTAFSLIQVEAYKKWLLVSLLNKGRSIPLPRTVATTTIKNIRAIARPYDCLVDAFKTNELTALRAEIDAGQRIWQEDSNMGLVIEVFHAFRRFQVKKLGNTFAALPIAEVAKRTSPDPNDLNETTTYITSLVAAGELNGVLSASQSTGQPTLRFLSSPTSTKNEMQLQQALGYHYAELQSLLRTISNNDHRLEISKEYIDMLRKTKKAKDAGAHQDGSKAPLVEDFDEDMMADE